MSLALALLFEARARSVARACERTDVRACVHRVRLTAREVAQRVREKKGRKSLSSCAPFLSF